MTLVIYDLWPRGRTLKFPHGNSEIALALDNIFMSCPECFIPLSCITLSVVQVLVEIVQIKLH